MNDQPTTVAGAPRPVATRSGVAALLGRVLATGLVAAAGVGGWIAVDRFDISLPVSGNGSPGIATALPSLGDGLPEARLASPPPWRQFSLTYQSGATTNRFWIDLDNWQLRIDSSGAESDNAVEIHGDQSYTRAAAGAEWVEQDVMATRDITAWLMADIGPYVLTDLVPPQTRGFTTLELEGTSRGERVYEVAVDAQTLLEQHPLAHQRWAAATRLVGDATGVYRIRVREDGYIVRIDGESASVQWDDLVGGVAFFSPLGDGLLQDPATDFATDAAADPSVDAVVDPVAVSPADAPVGD